MNFHNNFTCLILKPNERGFIYTHIYSLIVISSNICTTETWDGSNPKLSVLELVLCLSLIGQNSISSTAISLVTQNIVSPTILGNMNFLTSADVSQSLVLQALTKAKPTLEIKTDLYLPLLLPLTCFSLAALHPVKQEAGKFTYCAIALTTTNSIKHCKSFQYSSIQVGWKFKLIYQGDRYSKDYQK